MDALREGVSLQAYGQKDPLIVYKKEAYEMFHALLEDVNKTVVSTLWRAKIGEDPPERREIKHQPMQEVHETADNLGFATGGERTEIQRGAESHRNEKKQPIRVEKKTGRNAPCPCGSGKKYKQCHGKFG